MLRKANDILNIPIMVMIRPRGGDFVYSNAELNQMKKEIEFCKDLGVKGVVFGILYKNNTINFEQTLELSELALPMEITFHKAIDEAPSPIAELHKLLNIKIVTRILTSGKSKTAVEGSRIIKEMMTLSKDKITILPAGKITIKNLKKVHELIGGKEYHGRKIVGDLG